MSKKIINNIALLNFILIVSNFAFNSCISTASQKIASKDMQCEGTENACCYASQQSILLSDRGEGKSLIVQKLIDSCAIQLNDSRKERRIDRCQDYLGRVKPLFDNLSSCLNFFSRD